MMTAIFAAATGFLLTSATFARIGETETQIAKRYGPTIDNQRTPEERKRYARIRRHHPFLRHQWNVDRRLVRPRPLRPGTLRPPTPQSQSSTTELTTSELTPAEIDALLKVNGDSQQWVHKGEWYMRLDRKVCAEIATSEFATSGLSAPVALQISDAAWRLKNAKTVDQSEPDPLKGF